MRLNLCNMPLPACTALSLAETKSDSGPCADSAWHVVYDQTRWRTLRTITGSETENMNFKCFFMNNLQRLPQEDRQGANIAYTHLSLAWTKVEVKAAFKQFVNVTWIRRHQSKAGILLWNKISSPFFGFFLFPSALLQITKHQCCQCDEDCFK